MGTVLVNDMLSSQLGNFLLPLKKTRYHFLIQKVAKCLSSKTSEKSIIRFGPVLVNDPQIPLKKCQPKDFFEHTFQTIL